VTNLGPGRESEKRNQDLSEEEGQFCSWVGKNHRLNSECMRQESLQKTLFIDV
jgi:hypothetical protein